MKYCTTLMLRGYRAVFLGMMMLFLLSGAGQAQGTKTYVGFSFDGTTTCGTEKNVADIVAPGVTYGSTMHRSTETPILNSGPICVQTTSSNNTYNSKDWSTDADTTAYQLLMPGDQTYRSNWTFLFWGFSTDLPFKQGSALEQHFQVKKNGQGPTKGVLRMRFVNKSSGAMSDWYWSSHWVIPNASVQSMIFTFAIPQAPAVYDSVYFELHGWNQGSSSGQGDGMQIDNTLTIGPDVPLPVQLVSFSSTLSGNLVELDWKTATEINNYGFEPQRSINQSDWVPIGFVEGHGTVNSPQNYTFSDPVTPGMMINDALYYRLRQIDRDGREDFSPVVRVALNAAPGNIQVFQNYPNPFNPETKIAFSLDKKQPVSLAVYDVLGNEVERLLDNATLDEGFHLVTFQSRTLNSGMYLYALITAQGRFTRTMQLAK